MVIFGLAVGFMQKFLFRTSILEKIFVEEVPELNQEMKSKTKIGNQINGSILGLQKKKTNVFQELQQNVKQNEVDHLLTKVSIRRPFLFSFSEMIQFILMKIAPCFRCIKKEIYYQRQLYRDGVKLLDKEFDIVRIIRKIRKFNLMTKVILTKGQRRLIRYF